MENHGHLMEDVMRNNDRAYFSCLKATFFSFFFLITRASKHLKEVELP